MINQQLLDFIRQQQASGKNKEEITAALKNNGWKDEDIAAGFSAIEKGIVASVSDGLPGATEIFKEAWALFNRRFWILVGISALPIVLYIISGALAAGSIVAGIKGLGPVLIVTSAVLVIAIIYISIWSQTALILAIKDSEENIGIKESFSRSRPYIGQYFITSLAFGLMTGLGFILLVIPGIFIMVWYWTAPYASITENMTTGPAFKYAKGLVEGRFGAVLWRLVFAIIVVIVLNLLIEAATGILGLKKAAPIITNIISLFWTPLISVYMFLVYKKLQQTRS